MPEGQNKLHVLQFRSFIWETDTTHEYGDLKKSTNDNWHLDENWITWIYRKCKRRPWLYHIFSTFSWKWGERKRVVNTTWVLRGIVSIRWIILSGSYSQCLALLNNVPASVKVSRLYLLLIPRCESLFLFMISFIVASFACSLICFNHLQHQSNDGCGKETYHIRWIMQLLSPIMIILKTNVLNKYTTTLR